MEREARGLAAVVSIKGRMRDLVGRRRPGDRDALFALRKD
jgi:hypothetical protein